MRSNPVNLNFPVCETHDCPTQSDGMPLTVLKAVTHASPTGVVPFIKVPDADAPSASVMVLSAMTSAPGETVISDASVQEDTVVWEDLCHPAWWMPLRGSTLMR